MKRLRSGLTYSNVIATLALFIALGGASAFAATQLAKNSVGTKQLKNNAVTGAKIKNGAVNGAKVQSGSLTGSQINASTLGTVPNATHAASAESATNAEHAANSNQLGGLPPSGYQLRIGGKCSGGGSIDSVKEDGSVGCAAAGGPPSGPAEGALTGNYPSPGLAEGSIQTPNFASGAESPNSHKLNGIESSGFLQAGAAAGGGLTGTYPNPTLANNSVGSGQVIAGSIEPSDLSFEAATKAEVAASKPIVHSGQSTETTNIATTCTNYENSKLTIDAPSAGTVVISANAWLVTDHTIGNNDQVNIYIGESPTECNNASLGFSTAISMPSTEPTWSFGFRTLPVSAVFPVTAGTTSFYMNGVENGSDTQQFYFEGMTAVFYPN